MRLDDIERIGVVGAGQMGLGIAEVCAARGYQVTVSDLSQTDAARRIEGLAKRLEKRVARGKLDASDKATLLARITPVELDGHGTAQIVIEAATENVELKLTLFEALDRACAEGTILASNTSSISVSRIAAATTRPELVGGLHFMNPVPVMQLVEVVRGIQTSQATVELLLSLAERLDKHTVLSEDRPGFIVNRVLIPMLNEACMALEEGVASATDIDTGVSLGLNHPLGPLALADLIGLDTVLSIAEVLHRDFADSKYRPSPLLRRLVAAGWLGRKTGRGFYVYDDAGQPGSATVGRDS